MTAPEAVLPPRTFMQRPVLATATLKLPFWAMDLMFQFCEALPLQATAAMPVPLMAAPASRHCPELLTGDSVQLLPLGAMLKLEVASLAEALYC